MAETRIFASSNEYWSKQTEAGDHNIERRYGWCAAASALWCLNALKNVAPQDSMPDERRSGLLQVRYRWDRSRDFDSNLLRDIELKIALVRKAIDRDALLQQFKQPGVYWFCNHEHAMAIDTRNTAKPLFYDIESGLYSYSDLAELSHAVSSRYREDRWDVMQVLLA